MTKSLHSESDVVLFVSEHAAVAEEEGGCHHGDAATEGGGAAVCDGRLVFGDEDATIA